MIPATPLLVLGRRGSLCGLLPVALDHDHAEKRADDGGAEQDENDGDADGPNTGREEAVQRMTVVDKWLRRSTALQVSKEEHVCRGIVWL